MLTKGIFLAIPSIIFGVAWLIVRRTYKAQLEKLKEELKTAYGETEGAQKEIAKLKNEVAGLGNTLSETVSLSKYEALSQDLEEINRKKNFTLKELRQQIDVMHQQQVELERELRNSMSIAEHEQALKQLKFDLVESQATMKGLESQLEKAYFRLSEADTKLIRLQEQKNQDENES